MNEYYNKYGSTEIIQMGRTDSPTNIPHYFTTAAGKTIKGSPQFYSNIGTKQKPNWKIIVGAPTASGKFKSEEVPMNAANKGRLKGEFGGYGIDELQNIFKKSTEGGFTAPQKTTQPKAGTIKYKVGTKTYTIPEKEKDSFLKDFPKATKVGAPTGEIKTEKQDLSVTAFNKAKRTKHTKEEIMAEFGNEYNVVA